VTALIGGSQSRKTRVVAVLIALLLLSCIGFYLVSSAGIIHQPEAVVLDHNTDEALFTALPTASISILARPVYPYSVIPGGITSTTELATRVAQDPVIAKHYSGFNVSRARIVRARRNKLVHVAYRMHDKIFWTKEKLMVRKGEALVTDGIHYARTRCGNRISEFPVPPTSQPEPTITDLDPPLLPDTPPVTFPPSPSYTESRTPGLIPPSSGEPYFSGFASTPLAPGGVDVPGGNGPSDSVPGFGQPQPTSGTDVTPTPEPPTIWLTASAAACALFRQLRRNRRKH
jgi:hypothetical protein